MSNHFIGRGNLGADPELKHLELEGESRRVADLRIYCVLSASLHDLT